jgi:transketolase
MYDEKLIKDLEAKAKLVRIDALKIMKQCGMGWIGGSFSQADIVTALIFHHMRHDPENPQWEGRDRLIVSKSHCCETVYSALAEAGYFSKDLYSSYARRNAVLQAHTDRKAPGIEYSGGSLGQGLSFAIGEAIGARTDRAARYRVFCIIGDGELNEGQVWEAIMSAVHHKVDNLIAIIDHNKFQSTTEVSVKMNIEPIGDKWRMFGWDVMEIDGHDFNQILGALEKADTVPGKPHAIIANTVMTKGVPALENKNYHLAWLSDEMYAQAMEALK